jgi:hypothetical protein
LYADVGLIKINTNNDDNVLYDYMNSISNRGDFSLKQIVILLKDIYLPQPEISNRNQYKGNQTSTQPEISNRNQYKGNQTST